MSAATATTSAMASAWTASAMPAWPGPPAPAAPPSPGDTLARLASSRATPGPGGVLLEWRTGFEADNLGFHVWRQEGGARTRATDSLLAGGALISADSPLSAGAAYAWWDRAAAPTTY